MQSNRLPQSVFRRKSIQLLLASACALAPPSFGSPASLAFSQSPSEDAAAGTVDASQTKTVAKPVAPATLQPPQTNPAPPASVAAATPQIAVEANDANQAGLTLQPPTNSTLEIRVARRPWLLKKLIGDKSEESVKMDPPDPPAAIPADPPSMRMQPVNRGWQPRNRAGIVDPSSETSLSTADFSAATSAEQADRVDKEPEAGERFDVTGSGVAQPTGRPDAGDSDPALNVPPGSGSVNESASQDEGKSVRRPSDPRATDAAEEQELATEEQSATAEESVSEEIEVRPLRLNVDGSLKGKKQTKSEASSLSRSEPQPRQTDVEQEEGTSERVELDYTGYPRKPVVRTRSIRNLQATMQRCLRYYYARMEDANERSNWGVLHSIMVYGADTQVTVGRKSYNAIAWIAGNNACRGQRLLIQENGELAARSGVGLQGHQGQLLAILSLCDVPIDYTLYAGEDRFTVEDLVRTEMLDCRSGEELTFTLIGLAHYLDTDTVWRSRDGEIWDFTRLLREEMAQPIVGAACGGTHRLMGYAHALRQRRAEGKPIVGQWKRAEIYTNDFIAYAWQLQNRDGSMSTDWFEGREDNGDLDRKIQTTGHMVEWLLTVTPDGRLHDRRLVNAVNYLLGAMYRERGHDWKIGPKGHALRSLAMFYERAYGVGPAWRPRSVAAAGSDSIR